MLLNTTQDRFLPQRIILPQMSVVPRWKYPTGQQRHNGEQNGQNVCLYAAYILVERNRPFKKHLTIVLEGDEGVTLWRIKQQLGKKDRKYVCVVSAGLGLEIHVVHREEMSL